MTEIENTRRRPIVWPAAVAVICIVLAPIIAAAQSWTIVDSDEWCRKSDHYCEVREITLSADRGDLDVESTNGSIKIEGWDKNEIYVKARVEVRGSGESARETAEEVRISIDGTIKARGPRGKWWFGGNKKWSVSYRVMVPREFDVEAGTTNGSVSIADVTGDVEIGTTNGGLTLARVGGDVDASTTNGAIRAALVGDTWSGDGLDLHTTNGGISLTLPVGYSARLDAKTTNGGIQIDHPIRLEEKSRHRLKATMGDGGPTIRLRTTNGSVKVEEAD